MQYVFGKVQGRSAGRQSNGPRAPTAGSRILVVGVGGAGCAAVEWVREDCPEAATLAVNTDRISLEFHHSDTKVLLGERVFHGRGALGHADAAERAAREAREDLAPRLQGFDVVTILTSLGGGTGAGVAHVVAEQARAAGAAVVAVVTVPFRAERSRRARAMRALAPLRRHAHTTILIDSEALLPVAGHLPINQALGLLDYFMAEVPRCLVRVEAEARELVLDGGLGTITYHEWGTGEAGEAEPLEPLVMVQGTSSPGKIALLRVDAHAGHGHRAANRLAARVADAVSARHVPGEVRVTVRHDASIPHGGRALALLTGLEGLPEAEPLSLEVTLEPTRVEAAAVAPPAAVAPQLREASPQAPGARAKADPNAQGPEGAPAHPAAPRTH